MKIDNSSKTYLCHLYESSNEHLIRQVAHLFLMYSDGISKEIISRVLNISQNHIETYLNCWQVWGVGVLNTPNINQLLLRLSEYENALKEVKIENEESPILEKEGELINQARKGFLRKFIDFPFTIILAPFIYFYAYFFIEENGNSSTISLKEESNNLSNGSFNTIHLNESDGNTITQVIINNITKEKEEKKIKYETFFELYKNLTIIAQDRTQYSVVQSKTLRVMFNLLDKYGKWKYMYNFIIIIFTIYIIWGTTIKSILSGLLWLISAILLYINLQESNKPIVIKQVLPKVHIDTSTKQDDIPINSEFSPEKGCKNLAGIGAKEKEIINRDTINHKLKKYYVNKPDDRIYLHVVVYDNINYAAFQRNNLLSKNYKAKILPALSKQEGDTVYYVTIGDFSQTEIDKLFELKTQWDKDVKNLTYRANLKTN